MNAGGIPYTRTSAILRALRGLLFFILLISFSLPTPASADEWEPVAEGIDYRVFREPGPNVVHVARMTRGRPELTIETSLANRELADGKQTVSGMAELYDGTLSSWEPTWGSRMDVKVAINGSFHDVEDGSPHSGMVQSGWYIKRFNDLEGGSGFVWRLDGSAFIGTCINHPPEEQRLTLLKSGEHSEIGGINRSAQQHTITIYTPQYGRRTPERRGTEVLVQLDQPLTLLEHPSMVTGVIREFGSSGGNRGIPFDHVVVVPRGTAARWLRRNAEVGDRVGFSAQLHHYQSDCERRRSASFEEAYSSLSGSFEFLMDGELRSFDDLGATARNPRTAICYNEEYLYFIVVDGRDPGRSEGMSMKELGNFCLDRLDTEWGINQDGGGSSAMWIDGEIVNQPSDGRERAVANGLMMVVVEPMERSDRLTPGDLVRVTELVDLSVGPGDNYQTPWDATEGQQGTIVEHRHQLQGVLATDQYWWPVDFDGRVGWVREEDLELVEAAAEEAAEDPTGTPTPRDPNRVLEGLPLLQRNSLRSGPALHLGW